jgi:hypothetical protein
MSSQLPAKANDEPRTNFFPGYALATLFVFAWIMTNYAWSQSFEMFKVLRTLTGGNLIEYLAEGYPATPSGVYLVCAVLSMIWAEVRRLR